jgi:hypothetical protein
MAEKKFRKGDRVRFQFGIYSVEGIVKEDRGPLGINGRHLYRVEFPFGLYAESPSHIELPAEKLQLVQDAVSKGQ